jgi:hypothetical protein
VIAGIMLLWGVSFTVLNPDDFENNFILANAT